MLYVSVYMYSDWSIPSEKHAFRNWTSYDIMLYVIRTIISYVMLYHDIYIYVPMTYTHGGAPGADARAPTNKTITHSTRTNNYIAQATKHNKQERNLSIGPEAHPERTLVLMWPDYRGAPKRPAASVLHAKVVSFIHRLYFTTLQYVILCDSML